MASSWQPEGGGDLPDLHPEGSAGGACRGKAGGVGSGFEGSVVAEGGARGVLLRGAVVGVATPGLLQTVAEREKYLEGLQVEGTSDQQLDLLVVEKKDRRWSVHPVEWEGERTGA